MSGGTLVGAAAGDSPTGTWVCCDVSHAAAHRRPYLHTSDDVKENHFQKQMKNMKWKCSRDMSNLFRRVL